MHRTRREFLADVGKGMFLASLGTGVATDLGLSAAWAKEEPGRLTFDGLEPLVAVMQETAPDKVLALAVERLRAGTELKQLVAAAALANARTFGGEDYVGFHTLMALSPAYHMAREMPADRAPLPVLKVLYRNSNRMQEAGGRKNEVLHPVQPAAGVSGQNGGEALREAVRRKDLQGAERMFAHLAGGSADDALNQLMVMVDDATEVHRVVLVSRAWDLLNIVGRERAHTMLRQSVHYCVKSENSVRHMQTFEGLRSLLPKLLDQYRLLSRSLGNRTADDAWVAKMAETLFKATPEQAADAAAAALADGMTPDAVGEAMSLAANQLILRDNGRPKGQTAANKPEGSVHGDSIGVHACDSANAWRNIARAGDQRTKVTSLMLGCYQVARDRGERGGDFQTWQPYPRAEHLEKVKAVAADALLRELEGAIREKDQARAAALVFRCGETKQSEKPVFNLLRTYATSEDGALHAEKYFRTVTEEFAGTRPAWRWRQLVGLARVTASEYGQPAPGYAEACRLLKV